jgi:hypothetical protein
MDDRPSPSVGPATLTSASCSFYDFAPAWPCSCSAAEACSWEGNCVEAAQPADYTLTVTSQSMSQVFDETVSGGPVNLPGPQFSFTLTVLGQTITVQSVPIPGPLSNADGTLSGDYMTPTAVDLSWTPEVAGTHLLSYTRINHHVSEPTFTDCSVGAESGALHIDGNMLVPLSVVTGLEFQGVQHAQLAAAQLDEGCVQFELSVTQYLSL